MKSPVKGAKAAKTAGKADLRHGQLRVRQQPHRVLRAEPLEIVVVGTAKLIPENVGNVVFAVAETG